MNKPFKIRGKIARPLTLGQVAAKYALKSRETAKIVQFILPAGKTESKSKNAKTGRAADVVHVKKASR